MYAFGGVVKKKVKGYGLYACENVDNFEPF